MKQTGDVTQKEAASVRSRVAQGASVPIRSTNLWVGRTKDEAHARAYTVILQRGMKDDDCSELFFPAPHSNYLNTLRHTLDLLPVGRELCVAQVCFRWKLTLENDSWHTLGLTDRAASGLLPQVTEQQLRQRQEKSHMHLETMEC